MNNSDTIMHLAMRMNVDDSIASEWMRAVLDVLSGDFGGGAVEDVIHGNDDGFIKVETAPVLRPVTAESWEAIRCEELQMHQFPYRFGREGRIGYMKPAPDRGERRATCAKPNNDHYLQDRGTPLNISREHFQIEFASNGTFELVDRGSACGTIVNGNTIGGEYTNGRIPLVDGDTIVVGTPHSPYIFTFHLQSQASR
ncbi:MAG: FHA domain-containing protein [Halioglobus sp.]|nr:FHA domain-containing protein [Halioglobus sp.]